MKIKFFEECKTANLTVFQCPPVLFIIMGFVNIIAMIASYLLASRYIDEPEIAALIVMAVAVIFLIFGNIIVAGFTKIAEANQMKSEFISIISHQLRSPLSVFKWTLDVLSDKSGDTLSRDQISNYISTLRETTDRMTQMVNLLIEIGRIELGGFISKKEPVFLDKVTIDAVNLFSNFAIASNIELKVEIEPNLPAFFGDPERLKMAVENLIDNAIRYSNKKGIAVISVKLNNNKEIFWSIRDSGIGIGEEYKKFIFNKFFRAPNILRYQTRGSGLGLYIVKSIIEESGGKVGFESSDGNGSIFWFTLPYAKA